MSGRDNPGNNSGSARIKRIESVEEKAARKAERPKPPQTKTKGGRKR